MNTRIAAPYPCPTCGAKHPFDNVFCSDGYHSANEPYWPESHMTKVVPVTLDERTVAQIDVLGPRSTVIRQIIEEYCAERVARGVAIAMEARRCATGNTDATAEGGDSAGGEAVSPHQGDSTK